jgi:hypothetical protein
MNPSDSVKNIVSIILDISTKDLIFLTHHLRREMCFRQVEESDEGLGIRTINKETGKKSVNLELLLRRDKKQQRDIRDKLENELDCVERDLPTELDTYRDSHECVEIDLPTELENELDSYIKSKYDLYSECIENILTKPKPDVRKQKNIKPVYKNLRFKSHKRLYKERRAKRKPAAYLFK